MKLLRFFAAVVCWSLASLAFALPQNDAVQPKRLRIEPEVAAALLMNSVEPAYPESALADHVSGAVFLRIVVDQQGKVIEATPVSRDEWPPNLALTEDPRLREAAVKAVKQWEYLPYRPDGQPVELETQVVVKFKSGPIYRTEGGFIGGIIWSGPPPPKPAVQQILRVSAEAIKANLLKHVDPVYALISPNAPMQGEVRLQARISKTGDVMHLMLINGHPALGQVAMNAVRQWKYKPFLLNGEPVEAEGIVIVVFKR